MKQRICPFCQESLNREANILRKSRVIAETKTFLVFPTIGGFVDNYQLIVPKKHVNCFGELKTIEWQELCLIIDWQKWINKHYFDSNTSIFEHGALLPSNESGKSIVHAHLHIFPNNTTLFDKLEEYSFSIQKISSIVDLTNICHYYETYLYYKDVNGNDYIITHKEGLPSQFLRKVLADSLGITTWNWREFPYVNKIEDSLFFYRSHPIIYQQLLRRLKT